MHAPKEDSTHYRNRFSKGWDTLRKSKFERMKAMGILDEHWGLPARDEGVPAWEDLTAQEQDVFDLRMAIYAAQMTSMDAGVGRIVDTLETNGLLDSRGWNERINRSAAK